MLRYLKGLHIPMVDISSGPWRVEDEEGRPNQGDGRENRDDLFPTHSVRDRHEPQRRLVHRKNDVSLCFSLCFNGIPNRKNGKINGILPMIILMGQWDRTLAGYEWEISMEFNLPMGFGEFLVTVCQGTWPCKSSVFLICC